MEYQGIKGDRPVAHRLDHASSAQFGMPRHLHADRRADNREASTCSVSEITVTKMLDAASGPLWNELVKNTDGKDVTIDFTSTSAGADNTFMYVKLTNTLVSGMSFSSGGDRPSESVSLNFTKIETKYLEQAFSGTSATGGSVITYDTAVEVDLIAAAEH